MGLHWTSTSIANGAQKAESSLLTTARAIGFDMVDPALEAVLRSLIEQRPDFYESTLDEADVVVTDRSVSVSGLPAGKVLRIGERSGLNALETLEPGLVLSAASLIAAGYSIDKPEQAASHVPLSAREQQVARLLIDGASNKVIARALDISVHTAKFHVTAIMDKLDARNRADAVSILLRDRVLVD